MCYLPVDDAVALMPKAPSPSPVKNLTYIYEENLSRETEFGGSEFGGYPTLAHRADSYDIRESMNVHCGYALFSSLNFLLQIFPSYLFVLEFFLIIIMFNTLTGVFLRSHVFLWFHCGICICS